MAPVGSNLAVAVGGRVYLVDQATGNTIWRFPSGAPLESGSFTTGVTVTDTLVIAATDNRVVYGIDIKSGEMKWQHLSTERLVAAPAVAGKFLAIQLGDGSVNVIRQEDGTPVWDAPLRFFNGLVGSVGSSGNNIIVAGGDRNLYAVDMSSKKIRWQKTFNGLRSDFRPVLNGDQLFVTASDTVTIMSASTGQRRKEIRLADVAGTNATYFEGKIAVASRNGLLQVMDELGRPTLKKPFDLGSQPVSEPVLSKTGVTVATANGAINYVDFATEALTWNFVTKPMVAPADDKSPNYVVASGLPLVANGAYFTQLRDGSIVCFDKKNGVDLTGPSCKMVFPNSGDQVSGQPPLLLYYKVADETSGVNPNQITVRIDGQKFNHEYTRDGFIVVKFGTMAKNPLLTDGRKNIQVEVSDWLGNKTVAYYSLTIDNGMKPIVLPGTKSGTDNGIGRGGSGGRGLDG